MAKMDFLKDRLDVEVASYWTKNEVTGGADVTFGSGVMSIRLRSGYPFYESAATYDFTDSYAFVKITHPGATAGGSAEIIFNVGTTDDLNGYSFYIAGNPLELSAHHRTGTGTWTQQGTGITYNGSTHAWLRIQRTGSTINWDTSTTGKNGSWTNRWTRAANAWDHTVCIARMQCGDWSSDNLTAGTFDNFNSGPSPVPRRRGVRFFSRRF